MYVRWGVALLFATLASAIYGAEDPAVTTIQASVRKLIGATQEGDIDSMVALSHPAAIKLMGGEVKAKELLKASLESLRKAGVTTELKEVGQPTFTDGKDARYAVVPYSMIISVGSNKITTKTAVVGSSTDQGKSWKFLNLTEQGEQGLRSLLPELPQELKIPKLEQKFEAAPKKAS